MTTIQKTCPVVVKVQAGHLEIFAFVHPNGDKQLVKGTIEADETPLTAAHRELEEESGILVASRMTQIGATSIGSDGETWHFFTITMMGLRERWEHQTADDHGHMFSFFWHPLNEPLDTSWHAVFHQAVAFLKQRLDQSS